MPAITTLLFFNVLLASQPPVARVQSASGVLVLTRSDSASGYDYELTENNKVLWKHNKPLMLEHVQVTDTGVVVGVAETWSQGQSPRRGQRFVHVVFWDKFGREIANQKYPVDSSDQMSVEQVFIDETNDRVLVRILNDAYQGANVLQGWWLFKLSTGELLERLRPQSQLPDRDEYEYLVEVEPIRDTPLLVGLWCMAPKNEINKDDVRDAVVVVTDWKGNAVWSVGLKSEFERRRSGDGDLICGLSASRKHFTQNKERDTKRIVDIMRNHEFSIKRANSQTNRRFQAEKSLIGGWRIVELSTPNE